MSRGQFGLRFGQQQAKALTQRALLLGQIGDGIALEDRKKRAQRLAQGTIEVTFPDQGAIGALLKTLSQGKILFGQHNRFKQGYFIGRFAKTNPPVAATHGLQQAVLDQWLDEFEQKQFGNRISFGNIAHPTEIRLIDGAINQRPDCIIGLTREAHLYPFRGQAPPIRRLRRI